MLFEGIYIGLNNNQTTKWSSCISMKYYLWLEKSMDYLQGEYKSKFDANTI